MPRSYGSKKMTRRSNTTAAAVYLINAREPSVEVLMRSYGIAQVEAERMLAAERVRRERMV